jgi:hypothetical protein
MRTGKQTAARLRREAQVAHLTEQCQLQEQKIQAAKTPTARLLARATLAEYQAQLATAKRALRPRKKPKPSLSKIFGF